MLQANQVNSKDPDAQPVNSIGMPSQIELLKKQHDSKKTEMQDDNLNKLLAKYGGKKHMQVPMDVKLG